DPVGAWKAAAAGMDGAVQGLVHVDTDAPGYRRRRAGKGWVYLDRRGRKIDDPDTIARIRALAIPPAWDDVWICPDPAGHVQATGRDAKGRKQYRYHNRWNEVRAASKFRGLREFGEALPALRAQVDTDMSTRSLSFERVVATTVWMLDNTLIRI